MSALDRPNCAASMVRKRPTPVVLESHGPRAHGEPGYRSQSAMLVPSPRLSDEVNAAVQARGSVDRSGREVQRVYRLVGDSVAELHCPEAIDDDGIA